MASLRSRSTLLLLAGAILLPSFAACTPPANRTGRLLTMAGEEANFVDVLDERLTRQLNIADLQAQAGQGGESLKTLKLASDTLSIDEKDPKKAIAHTRRIAGWTSIAQLSRRAGDHAAAEGAYAKAEAALLSLDPEEQRAEYALSLSEVCEQIRGKPAAIDLLVKAGTWARKIDDVEVRRFALWTFSFALVNYDALEPARTVMKNDTDPRWRSDALAAMGRRMMHVTGDMIQARNTWGFAMNGARDASPATIQSSMTVNPKTANFNKAVQYEQTYRQQNLQSGQTP